MKISVFGTGYVGLVTGTCFSEMGNQVLCVDIDEEKIINLTKGISPIYELGLEPLIKSNYEAGRLDFTTNVQLAVESSDFLFIAVGTPSEEDGSADLAHVLEVGKKIGSFMNSYKIIVTKSTVPVGTSLKLKNQIEQELSNRKVSFDFDLISNPEFLREGTAVLDCLQPARVIVGCETERAKEKMHQLYEPFLKNGNPLHFMSILSSEMTKYAANAMLATKISFMNELSRLCEKTGADVEMVRNGIRSDPRIGFHFIYPGLGYGGSCFPKDIKALIKVGEDCGENLDLLKSVEKVNKIQRTHYYSVTLIVYNLEFLLDPFNSPWKGFQT